MKSVTSASGTNVAMRAVAIGNKASNVRTDLEKLQFDSFAEEGGTEDALLAAVQTLKAHFDGRVTETALELGFAGKNGFRILPHEEVKGPSVRCLGCVCGVCGVWCGCGSFVLCSSCSL